MKPLPEVAPRLLVIQIQIQAVCDDYKSKANKSADFFVFFVSGGIILGMNAKGNRLQHWSDMIKSPGQAHAKIHYLSANYID